MIPGASRGISSHRSVAAYLVRSQAKGLARNGLILEYFEVFGISKYMVHGRVEVYEG